MSAKDELKTALANALAAKIGGTLYLYSPEEKERVEKKILSRAKRTGEVASFREVSIWYTREEIVDLTKTGSDQYTWSKDGNRVKCNLVENSVDRSIPEHAREHHRKVIGTCYTDLN